MTKQERPLPTPPRSRFGADPQDETAASASLTSDRMAMAAAEGRLEEFLQRELPEGEHARTLAMMMMGMSGMMPAEAPAGPPPSDRVPVQPAAASPPEAHAAAAPVSPEMLTAVREADVAGLAELLRAEHAKRCAPDAAGGPLPASPPAADRAPALRPELEHPAPGAPAGSGPGRPGIDQTIVAELIRIAADNDVSVDWLTLRAIRLYVEDHRKTGRL